MKGRKKMKEQQQRSIMKEGVEGGKVGDQIELKSLQHKYKESETEMYQVESMKCSGMMQEGWGCGQRRERK